LNTQVENTDTKILGQKEKGNDRYNQLNPFGKGDPRFDYQKMKINKERDGPTGDFNIHMAAVVDKDTV
jgi:hypothetical protein